MAILQQNPDFTQQYIGWYGTCSDDEPCISCDPDIPFDRSTALTGGFGVETTGHGANGVTITGGQTNASLCFFDLTSTTNAKLYSTFFMAASGFTSFSFDCTFAIDDGRIVYREPDNGQCWIGDMATANASTGNFTMEKVNATQSFPLLTGSFNPGIGDFSLRHAVFPESDADINMATMQVPKSTFFKEIREVRADANAFKTYSGVQEVIFNIANSGVQELKLGRTYWIILQKGTDALDLPEFNFANEGTSSYEYRIADDCTPVTPPTAASTCCAVVETNTLKVDFDATELTGGNGDIKGVEIVFDNVVFGEKTGLSGGTATINDNFKDTNSVSTLDFYYDYSIRTTSVKDNPTEPNKTKSVIGFIDTTQNGIGATKGQIGQIQFSVASSSFTMDGGEPILADVRVYDSSAEVAQYGITRCEG